MIRIVIADDHTIVREGLKQMLSRDAELDVVAEAGDGTEVMRCVRELDFEVLVLDMSMPGRSGPELIKLVREEKPKLRILVLSMHQEPQYAIRALKSGAAGYLTKDSASLELVAAIRKVAGGGASISAEVAEQLALGAMPSSEGPAHAALSDREFQVFRLLVDGENVSAIGERLNLSIKTVSTHKARILQKMGMGSTSELVRYAVAHKLVDDKPL